MRRVMVRYRVKRERVEENEALVRAVYEELARTRPPVHLASVETEDGHNPLSDVAAFHEFQREIGDRCDEAPVVTELSTVGSFRIFGDA
jgi:hypothetical protein